jgi:hypothetical protein
METTVALVTNLLDRSRLAPLAGIVFVDRAEDLIGRAGAATTAIVDLTVPGALAALPALRERFAGRIVAFGPHVGREALQAARAAGADTVLTRSRLLGTGSPAAALGMESSPAAGR